MLDQTFTVKNFKRILTKKDFIKFNLKKNEDVYIKELKDKESEFNSGKLLTDDINTETIKNKIIYNPTSFHNILVLRNLNRNIKKLYLTKQSNRNIIIKQIKCIMREWVELGIIKIDIKNFYESINRDKILKKLLSDGLLSYNSKILLKHLFDKEPIKSSSGLPRGLSISSSMSEISMRKIDNFIKLLPDVYYYTRYVDDILIFHFPKNNNLLQIVKDKIEEEGFKINYKKHTNKKIENKCKNLCHKNKKCICHKKSLCQCVKCLTNYDSFDYLGYKFIFPLFSNKSFENDEKNIIVDISNVKINKYKTKIMQSFLSFIKDKDFKLLHRRIKYLTGNSYVDVFDPKNKIKRGIYYNYQGIEYLKNKNLGYGLNELDNFLNKTIYSKNGSFGKKLSCLITSDQKNILKKYTFSFGHNNKVFNKFNYKELCEIKKCWTI